MMAHTCAMRMDYVWLRKNAAANCMTNCMVPSLVQSATPKQSCCFGAPSLLRVRKMFFINLNYLDFTHASTSDRQMALAGNSSPLAVRHLFEVSQAKTERLAQNKFVPRHTECKISSELLTNALQLRWRLGLCCSKRSAKYHCTLRLHYPQNDSLHALRLR